MILDSSVYTQKVRTKTLDQISVLWRYEKSKYLNKEYKYPIILPTVYFFVVAVVLGLLGIIIAYHYHCLALALFST